MNIKSYHVHPALKEFVETIFHVSTNGDQDEEILQTSLPPYECFIGFEYDKDFLVKNINASEFNPIHKATIIPPQLGTTLMRGRNMKAVMVKFNYTCKNNRWMYRREWKKFIKFKSGS